MPPRSTSWIRTVTSGKPSRAGTPSSHSRGAPAAINAPRSMSPLMPAAGSRMAKRPSDIVAKNVPGLGRKQIFRIAVEPAGAGVEYDDAVLRRERPARPERHERRERGAALGREVDAFVAGAAGGGVGDRVVAYRDGPPATLAERLEHEPVAER